ncbi:hypothetical protein ACLUXI_02045 [Bifidobacterium apri]|uniref:hypothetical protein n=1 Tax=Bifidobacterium apri TaxID=1769423 RepID=UPI0039944500
MKENKNQPRIPAGRREGGQFTQTDKTGETTDLAPTFGDSKIIDAIVAAGAEAHVAGINAEQVSAYLAAVGHSDVLSGDEAARRLSPWQGLKANGKPAIKKATLLTSAMCALVDEVPDQPYDYHFLEEGRQIALTNLLEEAHDRQAFAARRLGFSDEAAEEYAMWAVNFRLAEATRNLGKPDKMTLDLLAATVLTNSIEKFLTRQVPKPDEAYLGAARLGRAFEGTNRVGADFVRYAAMLKPRNEETEAALWDSCARKRMDDALGTAWDAQFDKIKAKFGVEPIDYCEFYDSFSVQSRSGITPLNYRPAKENPQRLAEIRRLAASGDRQAMATVAAWDAAVKSAGSHNATMLSSGRSSVPFARNKVHRAIELPYKPTSMSVEGTRRGARYIYRYANGLAYYKDGIAQFRNARPVSLNKPVSSDEDAAEFGDFIMNARGGGSYRERAAADPAEIFDVGQRYASAAAIAKRLPNNEENNTKLRDFLGIDLRDEIKDEQARDAVIARDITKARAEGMPEAVIRRLWKPQSIEKANTFAKGLAARRARAKTAAAAAQRRLHELAAQRRAAQPAR